MRIKACYDMSLLQETCAQINTVFFILFGPLLTFSENGVGPTKNLPKYRRILTISNNSIKNLDGLVLLEYLIFKFVRNYFVQENLNSLRLAFIGLLF